MGFMSYEEYCGCENLLSDKMVGEYLNAAREFSQEFSSVRETVQKFRDQCDVSRMEFDHGNNRYVFSYKTLTEFKTILRGGGEFHEWIISDSPSVDDGDLSFKIDFCREKDRISSECLGTISFTYGNGSAKDVYYYNHDTGATMTKEEFDKNKVDDSRAEMFDAFNDEAKPEENPVRIH